MEYQQNANTENGGKFTYLGASIFVYLSEKENQH